jgi:two-component system LytT family sensor kinase
LRENGHVTGTLKIFFCRPGRITSSTRELAVGLSQLISTQLEVSRVKQLQEMAGKAEFRALQSKINPHFLFNALNAISSLIRVRPPEARRLIANLADYLRYNLSLDDGMIDIQNELQQVRDYVAIEQARFGPKLDVVFDVDDVHLSVPSLLLQPLVENAVLHGIQPQSRRGEVRIAVKRDGEVVHVRISDSGRGIDPEIIEEVARGRPTSARIGLMNVHERLKLLYGKGLEIVRTEPGTAVSFDLPLPPPAPEKAA